MFSIQLLAWKSVSFPLHRSFCIRTTRPQQPPLAEQSPTYNKYYTYLTYVWCRHVLFIALDRKIIGEKCSWFRLSLLSDFIMLFFLLSFHNVDFTYCTMLCVISSIMWILYLSTYGKLKNRIRCCWCLWLEICTLNNDDICGTNQKPHSQLWLLLLIGASIL